MNASDIKGICRNVLGGESGTLSQVFQNISRPDLELERHEDLCFGIRHCRIDLPSEEGTGGWDLLEVGNSIFAILTECEYFTPRSGSVPSEGLIGFHFVLAGPIELGGAGTDRALAPVTMLVGNQAPGVSYSVFCPVGTSRMISLYATPDILRESFGLSDASSRLARRLCCPSPDTISTFETMIDARFSELLEELMRVPFGRPGGLAQAMSLLLRVLGKAVEAVIREAPERSGESFTTAELLMLEQARRLLSSDLSSGISLAEIAERLGTNQTKLKRGLKAIFGITASAHRRDCRMREAERLLVEEGLAASTVAYRVGYSAHASFTAAFRAHHGVTPKAMRARHTTT